MVFSLENQIALVTGGANGIGRGIVETLAEAGAKVVIGDINEEAGKEAAKAVNGDFLYLDISDQKRCEEVIDAIVKKYGRLDILAQNAGIFPQSSIEDMTEEDFDLMHDVNLKGTFFITKPALKVMKEQKYGRVVLTSSVTGPITGVPNLAHYASSKAGQLGYMRVAALEYAQYGVTINAVMPGTILTGGVKEGLGQEAIDEIKKIIPTHDVGEPKDIGYAVNFFASKEAKFITGQSLAIDGGQILPEFPDAVL